MEEDYIIHYRSTCYSGSCVRTWRCRPQTVWSHRSFKLYRLKRIKIVCTTDIAWISKGNSKLIQNPFAMNSSTLGLFLSSRRLRPSVLRKVSTVQLLRSPIGYRRRVISSNINRPSPPPLPRDQQREFEDLLRAAQAPLSVPNNSDAGAGLVLHPDTQNPLKAEFEGDINPVTGEEGGPKREPIGQWNGSDGDWSFKGRVTDF